MTQRINLQCNVDPPIGWTSSESVAAGPHVLSGNSSRMKKDEPSNTLNFGDNFKDPSGNELSTSETHSSDESGYSVIVDTTSPTVSGVSFSSSNSSSQGP